MEEFSVEEESDESDDRSARATAGFFISLDSPNVQNTKISRD